MKNKDKYFKALGAIPDVREVEVALDRKFYITFLFSVRKEDRECKF